MNTPRPNKTRRLVTGGVVAFVMAAGFTAPPAGAAPSIVVAAGESIQAAIDAASPGDVIHVQPGTYFERLDFGGKDVKVRSTAGAVRTTIDGGASAADPSPVVRFENGETRAAVLDGFTIRGGWDTATAGGVWVSGAAPTIKQNLIQGNVGCSGVGVHLVASSARVVANRIEGNSSRPSGNTGCRGGGIQVQGAGSAEIVDNLIFENDVDASGGGIDLFAAGDPFVNRNVIGYNAAARGGGMSSANANSGRIANNLLVSNHATVDHGGVDWTTPAGNGIFEFINNTVVGNTAAGPSKGMHFSHFSGVGRLVNNVLSAEGGTALSCGSPSGEVPQLRANTIWSDTGQHVSVDCTVTLDTLRNETVDPQVDRDGYPLPGSPIIDSGVPDGRAGNKSLGGFARVLDGDGDGEAVVDRGAVENPPPPAV